MNPEALLSKAKREFDATNYTKSLEYSLLALGASSNIETEINARIIVARSYFRMNDYDLAYEHYSILSQTNQQGNNGKRMMAYIEGVVWGQYSKAIKTIRKLDKTNGNRINLAFMLVEKYKEDGGEYLLFEAKREIKKTENIGAEIEYQKYHAMAEIERYLNNPRIAETYYKKSLEVSRDFLTKANVMAEYGSFLIDTGYKDSALKVLTEAEGLVGDDTLEKGYIYKYLGMLYLKNNENEKGIYYLELAFKILKEKRVCVELYRIYTLLVHKDKPNKHFYELAKKYAKSLEYSKYAEEVIFYEHKTFSGYCCNDSVGLGYGFSDDV